MLAVRTLYLVTAIGAVCEHCECDMDAVNDVTASNWLWLIYFALNCRSVGSLCRLTVSAHCVGSLCAMECTVCVNWVVLCANKTMCSG